MDEQKKEKPLRLLVILEKGFIHPSSFLRAWMFREQFDRAGYVTKFANHYFAGPLLWRVKPLFDLYTYLNELRLVRLAKSADVVYLAKVHSFRLISRLKKTGARLVLITGDAFWLPQYADPDLDRTLPLLDMLISDNEETLKYLRQFNPNCVLLPDCPQIELFDAARAAIKKNTEGPVVLGWVGTQSTVYNLYLIWEVLERLFAKHKNLHLRLVGTGNEPRLLPPFEKVKYSVVETYTQAEMVREVLKMDIGLFPLQDTEGSRVRGVLKASVYMSGEAAVIGSPVGQSADFIKEGVNGMLANSDEEWERKLEQLISDKPLRQKLAKGGLETVRDNFTLERAFAILRSALEGKKYG